MQQYTCVEHWSFCTNLNKVVDIYIEKILVPILSAAIYFINAMLLLLLLLLPLLLGLLLPLPLRQPIPPPPVYQLHSSALLGPPKPNMRLADDREPPSSEKGPIGRNMGTTGRPRFRYMDSSWPPTTIPCPMRLPYICRRWACSCSSRARRYCCVLSAATLSPVARLAAPAVERRLQSQSQHWFPVWTEKVGKWHRPVGCTTKALADLGFF